MTTQITIQTDRSVSKNNRTEDVVSILETQLGAFRSIYEITSRMRDKFARSDVNVLKNGLQERKAHLENAHKLESQLRELKREWEATSRDARVSELVDECQKVINKIVDLDMALHRDASHQQRVIKAELSETHQRRQPIATYLATPAISASYSVPVAGRSVVRNA
ncbi:MAG: hypothetical protein QF437_00450 [Planctomycetota bacterium]|jgi:hypothetical protein|nr:hypothetical protein [Planctomycetota bacterium]MDP7247967.1 hypothetical protein [Planctomycetota bacterium]